MLIKTCRIIKKRINLRSLLKSNTFIVGWFGSSVGRAQDWKSWCRRFSTK